jgi:hypothetical protein
VPWLLLQSATKIHHQPSSLRTLPNVLRTKSANAIAVPLLVDSSHHHAHFKRRDEADLEPATQHTGHSKHLVLWNVRSMRSTILLRLNKTLGELRGGRVFLVLSSWIHLEHLSILLDLTRHPD